MTNLSFANIGPDAGAALSSNIGSKTEGYFTNAELRLIPQSMVDFHKNKLSRVVRQFIISIFSLGV